MQRSEEGYGMAVVIRRMRVEDIDDVKRVDAIAWDELVKRFYPEIPRMTSRTDDGILSYLHSDPDGALVAVDGRAGVVGSCFSHVWGKTGWVGPISVLTSYQGAGVGKQLLKASLNRLEEKGCSDIGLETSPEIPASIGMYLKVGLRPEGMLLVLGKDLSDHKPSQPSATVSIERLSRSNSEQRTLARIKEVSNTLNPGLDYSGEAALTKKFSFGDTLVAKYDGRVCGFSTVHTLMRRVDMVGAAVRCLGVRPGYGEIVLEELVSRTEDLVAEAGVPEVLIAAPGNRRRAVDVLLSRGYIVTQTLERMMWMGSSGLNTSTGDNLCSWSG
jgi:ribosomal protein S18 acetylase RimI-like enzyme